MATTTATATPPPASAPAGPAVEVTRRVEQSAYAAEVPEGVGGTVRRAIGMRGLRNLSPFLMLDHFTVKPGAGFPDHPHRGQTTVTYLHQGQINHEDFLGNSGAIKAGDVQWMTAGRGVMHSEMPYFGPDPKKPIEVKGLQLWIDLPAKDKFIEPSYQDRKAKDIVTIHPQNGLEITVISGESHGVKGHVRPVGGCWYMDFKLQKPGIEVFQPIPEGWTAFIYLVSGKIRVGGGKVLDKFHTHVLTSKPGENGVHIARAEESDEDVRFAIIAGEPLNQPIVQYGPFVVTSQIQAMEAVRDFQLGQNGFERAVGWKSKIAEGFKH
ncbi:hypothetical protein IAT38_002480 [Cryptococcus sp. DSM 104549]